MTDPIESFTSKFAEFESELARFARVFVGFSGGADSTALLILLAKLAERHPFALEIVHFEHGLRGDASLADAEWCREFAKKRLPAILSSASPPPPFNLVRLKLDPNSSDLEAAARSARMEHWRRFANADSDAVALGHHADDKIENLFIRMLRGSNSTGLASPRISRNVAGVDFLRPLLLVRRLEIEEFLRSIGVDDWREDRTNAENKQSRNFIRNKVIPLINEKFPDADKALLRSIAALEDDAAHLEAEAKELYFDIRRELRGNRHPALDSAKFAAASPALKPRVLRLWLADALGFDQPPTRNLIKRATSTIMEIRGNRGKSTMIPLNANILIEIDDSNMRIVETDEIQCREVPSITDSVEWKWRKSPELEWSGHRLSARIVNAAELLDGESESILADRACQKVFFDADELPDTLNVRNRVAGDKIIPFGSNSATRVKKVMQTSTAPREVKATLPIVTLPDGTIIWIPLTRRANFANLAPNHSGKIVELSFKLQ